MLLQNSYEETLALIKKAKAKEEAVNNKAKSFKQALKTRIKTSICPVCPHNGKCQHDLFESISFFMEAFGEFHILPKTGFYVVNRQERYKAEQCELEILRELWAQCPTRCRYCHYASSDKDGDWWCSRPAPGEEGRLIFRNLALLKVCPKEASSFRNKNRQRKLGVR